MNPTRILAPLAAAALLAGCLKDTSSDRTEYVLKPLAQTLSTDPYEPLDGVVAYAFDADTARYTVASYEDALNGIASLKDDPSAQLQAVASSEPYAQEGTTGWVRMSLPMAERRMILAVDTEHRLYAYTEQELVETLPSLYVTLIFKTWKEGTSYKDGNWCFFNEFYTPPQRLDTYVRPLLQSAEDAAAAPFEDPGNLKVNAYAVDTTAWKINSYNDAAQRIITSKSDPKQTRTSPDFEAYYSKESGTYGMKVSSPTLMVVVTDPVNQLYAYSQQEVEIVEGGQPVNFLPVVFRPWKQEYLYVEEGGGRVVNDKLAPKEPEKASKR